MEEDQDDHHNQARVSASRRTRSQAAPDWTAQESLTLVNEIAAVEGDCRNSLSSFQKWKIIVANCNALDVNRTLNQCRRKWDLLLSDYQNIKQWETSSSSSYWSLDGEGRREFGLPVDFDSEVFKAIDDHLKAEDGSDTEPDDDPEAVAGGVNVVAESGHKKKSLPLMPQKQCSGDMLKPHVSGTAKKIIPEQMSEEEKVKSPKHRIENSMLDSSSIENRKQMVTEILCENAVRINAIVQADLAEDADCVLADLKNAKNAKTSQIDFTRQQGDNIIACLGNLKDALDQYYDLLQKSG